MVTITVQMSSLLLTDTICMICAILYLEVFKFQNENYHYFQGSGVILFIHKSKHKADRVNIEIW